jgi:branched-chain amino acid transport system ATP-binding protein
MTERNIGDVILKVDNISLSFGVMKVLDDISFDIRQGEIRSIIGPNGAGKSSMLNVINGSGKWRRRLPQARGSRVRFRISRCSRV